VRRPLAAPIDEIVGATLGSLLLAQYFGPLASLLRLAPPSVSGWLVAAVVAIATTCWTELFKMLPRASAPTPKDRRALT